jgi:UMF1 family MFS transporter
MNKRIWGWFFFDWASQPYHTVLVTFVFGPFFAGIAAEYYIAQGLSETAADAQAQSLWSMGLTFSGLIIGLGAPLIGALADTAGKRIPWIVGFSVMYFLGAAGLWLANPDGSNMLMMLALFAFGFIGAEYALIFVNSQLPGLGTKDEVGDISGSGFAFGYVGGLVALAILLALFVEQPNGKTLIGMDPVFGLDADTREGTRFAGPFTALWYLVFMVPYFMWVKDPKAPSTRATLSVALGKLGQSVRGLKKRVSLSSYLGSSMLYRDALNGLYGFGGTYAKLVLNWELVSIGIFGIVGGLAAAVFSWIGGKADRAFGPKPVIKVAIWVLILVCITIVSMDRSQIFGIALPPGSTLPDITFFVCGALIGGMGGVLQAASRSLMVRHTDPDNPTESFGLYGLSGRATAFIAPMLIGTVTVMTQSARIGISPVIVLFLLGLILLRWVNPKGDRATWSDTSA